MFRNMIILCTLLWNYDVVKSVRIVELRTPTNEAEGGSATLDCEYDMEGDILYSVKWYKDGREFYRYVPKNIPAIRHFPVMGVVVDESRSSNSMVRLERLTQDSAGIYKCEVSGEAPHFTTVFSQKYMLIQLLPKSAPHISGQKSQYYLDELVSVNCTSSASRPVACLKWFINDLPAPQEYVTGPWKRALPSRSDAIELILQLRFIVAPAHFVGAKIKLRCLATIAPLYQMETVSTHYIALPLSIETEAQGNADYMNTDFASTLRISTLTLLLPMLTVILVE